MVNLFLPAKKQWTSLHTTYIKSYITGKEVHRNPRMFRMSSTLLRPVFYTYYKNNWPMPLSVNHISVHVHVCVQVNQFVLNFCPNMPFSGSDWKHRCNFYTLYYRPYLPRALNCVPVLTLGRKCSLTRKWTMSLSSTFLGWYALHPLTYSGVVHEYKDCNWVSFQEHGVRPVYCAFLLACATAELHSHAAFIVQVRNDARVL